MLRKLHLLIILLVFVLKVEGQDIHFTQFYMQPLTINPALGGDYYGGLRGSFINRRQWGQLGVPIQTMGASIEQKIWLNGDYLVLGGVFANDRASQAGYVTTKSYFSSTYLKNASNHWFGIGVQLGFARTTLDPDQTFPSQFNAATGTFDASIANNDPVAALNRSYLDVNVGFFWKMIYQNRYRFKTGFSVSHVNMPDESFSGNTQRIPIRYLIHHSTEYIVNSGWSLISQSQLIYTGTAKQFTTHALAKRKFSKTASMIAGLGYRGYVLNSDAAILILGISYHYIDLGISYDWNVSPLSRDNSQKTTVEFSLGIRTPSGKKKPILYKKGKPCPVYVDHT